MTLLLFTLILLAALLYSAVGHGGGSGYLAAMALGGVAPEEMKPAALTLNVLVATIATARFASGGHFNWSVFWPFAVGSVPLAFVGGWWQLPDVLYKPVVAVALLFIAFRLAQTPRSGDFPCKPLPLGPAVIWGAVIGLLSGLTGIGGGVLLSPLLLLAGWADIRQSAAVSAPFILVNSAAALAGYFVRSEALPEALAFWAVAAVVGGLVGSELGSRHLGGMALRRVLAVVTAAAAVRIILG